MKLVTREAQVVVAGRVGAVNDRTDGLVSVSVANRKGKDETEWVYLTFTNPLEEGKGQKLANLAREYIDVGQYITALCNEVEKGEYTNYYVNFVELGPKSPKTAE